MIDFVFLLLLIHAEYCKFMRILLGYSINIHNLTTFHYGVKEIHPSGKRYPNGMV